MPYVVFMPKAGEFKIVDSVATASAFLFHHWADYQSQTWTDAMDSCHHAENGTGSVEGASIAFFIALRGAGILMHQPNLNS